MGYLRRIRRIVEGEWKTRTQSRRTPDTELTDRSVIEELDDHVVVVNEQTTSAKPSTSTEAEPTAHTTDFIWACNYLGVDPACTREKLEARVSDLRARLSSVSGHPQVDEMLNRLERAYAIILERLDPTAARMRRIDL